MLTLFVLAQTQAQDIIKHSYRLNRSLPVESGIKNAQVIRFSPEEIVVLKKAAAAGPSLLDLSIDGYQWPLRLTQQNAELAVRTGKGQIANPGPVLLTELETIGPKEDNIRPYYYLADSMVFPFASIHHNDKYYYAEFAFPSAVTRFGIGATEGGALAVPIIVCGW